MRQNIEQKTGRRRLFYRNVFFFLELAVSVSLAAWFIFKIYQTLSPSQPQLQGLYIKKGAFYVTARINSHIPPDGFFNFVSFNYTSFAVRYPSWDAEEFQNFIDKHSLFLTNYSIDDICTFLLEAGIRYWEIGSVEISLYIKGRWEPVDKFIDFFPSHYSFGDIVFLTLGMDNLRIRDIGAKDFIRRYFGNRRIEVLDRRIFKLKRVIIRIKNGDKPR